MLFGINGPMYQGGADRLSDITAVRGVATPQRPARRGFRVEGQEAQIRNPAPPRLHVRRAPSPPILGTEQGPKEERRQLTWCAM